MWLKLRRSFLTLRVEVIEDLEGDGSSRRDGPVAGVVQRVAVLSDVGIGHLPSVGVGQSGGATGRQDSDNLC